MRTTKIYQFKAKDFEIKIYRLCLGNIFKTFAVIYMIKEGLNGYVYDVSVDFNILTRMILSIFSNI